MSEFFSVLSGLVFVGVIICYFKQLVDGHSTPNPATWLIWVVVALLNTATYLILSNGNLYKSILTIILTAGTTAVFIYALYNGRFGKMGWVEYISISLAFIVGVIWQLTGNAILANFMLQIIFLISFVPTVVGLLRGELEERLPPWVMAVTSYILLIIGIVFDWQGWAELAYPVINGVLGNGSVVVTIIIVARNQKMEIKNENHT